MTVVLEKIVPWGRSIDEYTRMFDLSEDDLQRKILDCAAGPASFAAQMRGRGRKVVCCDPIYQFSGGEISLRISEAFPKVIKTAEQNWRSFVWREVSSLEELGKLRMRAMALFLSDLTAGSQEGRYIAAELPELPFRDGHFGIALCSHFLFTSTALLSETFHLEAIRELCRIAKESRIFPLVPSFEVEKSNYLHSIISSLTAGGHICEIKRVPYEFQRGANEMLCVRKAHEGILACRLLVISGL